ncbi:MAG TPA: hypothetical protein VFH29_07590 [Anaerolineales bacterium]|nr:hypothetical protein [Anaerolineales bacterium]
MRPVPFRSQPVFRAVVLAILLVATWIYDYVKNRNDLASAYGVGLDIALWVVFSLASLFIFAQFALPIKTLQNRIRLAAHLWMHAWGVHGAVVFVQNGRRVERRGEAGRRGPGVVWVDTASAALTRNDRGQQRVLGPGIHFTLAAERVEKTFSLHVQTCSVGPASNEPIFEALPDDANEEQRALHESSQARRRAASGLTRDGNEVVPEIQITFKLEGAPAPARQPGSRFGYSSEAVERAARSEGVSVDPISSKQSLVAWNQLPGLIAVDLWREYLGKYTLDDLFTVRFEAAPDVIQPEQAPPEAASTNTAAPAAPKAPLARALWRLNNRIEHSTAAMGVEASSGGTDDPPPPQNADQEGRMLPGREYTAMQVIAHMVRARMMFSAVPVLDESGRYSKGHVASEESRRLRERGIRVLDVAIRGLRFSPAVEDQLVQQWRTAWLDTATGERGHVEQLEVLAAEAGRQRALLEHAGILSKAVRAEPTTSVPAALKALLAASHAEILTDERLRGRGMQELLGIAGLAKWVESPEGD